MTHTDTSSGPDKCKVLVITGPTATGKTARAVAVARAIGGEIISADSRQVYRGMDIGTGKDLEEYGDVPVHLLDVVPAGYRYTLYEYLRDARRTLDDIACRQRTPVVCGGTGLYVESLAKGIVLPQVEENRELRLSLQGKSLSELAEILSGMKALHNVTDIDTPQRAIRAIEIETFYLQHPEEAKAAGGMGDNDRYRYEIVCIDIPRDKRRERISQRLHARLEAGMVDEARRLLAQGVSADTLIYYGLEYKFLAQYLTGQTSYDEMVSGLEIAIHQFAKRQMTWFRGMERRGFKLHWLPFDISQDEFVSYCSEILH